MYKVLLALTIACAVISCSKNNTPSTPAVTIGASGMMPLAVGNQWNYQMKFYDSATGTVDSTATDQINIISQTTINDTTYFQQVQSSKLETWASFYLNTDSNTVVKIDSSTYYTFFKRVTNSTPVGSWADTVKTHCTGENTLYAYTGDTTINTYTNCLKNIVTTTDCTGQPFQQYVYYFQPGTGTVRIEYYLIKNDNVTWYLKYTEDLTSFKKE
jgi:uncharacterized protein with NAD-binding domain and iron-sulfur cluster